MALMEVDALKMEMLSSAAHDDSSGANPSSVKSDDSSPRHEGGRGSPPPNCAICLGTCRNKSFTDSCLHQFCFKCLLTWSKVKAECPLCKQNFKSIIHNVRSNHQYDEYSVEQRHTEEPPQSIDIDTLTNATRRFRYRTTLTLPRRETLAIQQLLLHYPLMADVFPPPAPRAPPARRRREPAAFRRTVYRHNLWARPLPDFTGRFRDCTPEFYRYNDSQQHRLVPWLNRELHYLLNENIGHISYVLTRILELLPQYHINSPEFREAMQRYFGDRTEHFLHELYCFASTPYDMTGYDRNVQYTTDSRISTMVNEVISSSDSEASVDSDIVVVSSSEPAEPPPGPSRPPAPVYPHNYIPPPPADNVISIETLSQSDTDDDSSEVMVVGYIKPPQDRTPEVVDLLGSDSDVIVQDTAQPEPSQSGEGQEARPPAPLVKLSLKRQRARSRGDSDSDDATYRPPPPRRRRRPRSAASHASHASHASQAGSSAASLCTCSSADTWPATPPPPAAGWPDSTASPSSSPSPSPSPSPSSSSLGTEPDFSSSSSSSGSYARRKKATKKKAKRKTRRGSSAADKKKSKKRKSRSRHRERSASKTESRDRRSKRKSQSGKGVKSSKKSSERMEVDERALTPPLPEPAPREPQPGPSGTGGTGDVGGANGTGGASGAGGSSPSLHVTERERRRRSHESKRLKSVVNVIKHTMNPNICYYNSAPSGSAMNQTSDEMKSETDDTSPLVKSETEDTKNASSNSEATDSEDNLPLNLTMRRNKLTML